MKRIDGYLSRKAQEVYPDALVYVDEDGPIEVWTMRRYGGPDLGLGGSFNAAKQAVAAMKAAAENEKRNV